jgi:hypothetical protein
MSTPTTTAPMVGRQVRIMKEQLTTNGPVTTLGSGSNSDTQAGIPG